MQEVHIDIKLTGDANSVTMDEDADLSYGVQIKSEPNINERRTVMCTGTEPRKQYPDSKASDGSDDYRCNIESPETAKNFQNVGVKIEEESNIYDKCRPCSWDIAVKKEPKEGDTCSSNVTFSREHPSDCSGNHSGTTNLHAHKCIILSDKGDNAVCIKDKPNSQKSYPGNMYKCDVFSYSTVWPSDIATHKCKRPGEKPYKCDVCSFKTITSSYLERHKRKHTAEKPYKCDVCSYSAAWPSHLARHKRKHSGEGSYKCDVCSYTTISSSHLVVYKR